MLKQMWQSLIGKADAKDVVHAMAGKQDHSGEGDEERRRRQDEENAATAATSPGAF
jgi:hypothetical protein